MDRSYDIIDTASNQASGAPAKNCTGSGCCIPKCFAEKGNRGLPGLPGLPGPKVRSMCEYHCVRLILLAALFTPLHIFISNKC